MIIKWYNRDSISDQDMKQAEAVAKRLLGKKASPDPIPDRFFTGSQMITPIQYGSRTATGANRMAESKKPSALPFGWEPAPQWARDAKEDDTRREAR